MLLPARDWFPATEILFDGSSIISEVVSLLFFLSVFFSFFFLFFYQNKFSSLASDKRQVLKSPSEVLKPEHKIENVRWRAVEAEPRERRRNDWTDLTPGSASLTVSNPISGTVIRE